MFKGLVAWTGKRPETGPNQTDLDQTIGCSFQMDGLLMDCESVNLCSAMTQKKKENKKRLEIGRNVKALQDRLL